MNFPSKLTVGSCLIYPKGGSKASRDAVSFVWDKIKQDKTVNIDGKPTNIIRASIQYLVENLAQYPKLEELLTDAGTLVPLPRSAPQVKGGLWVPLRIAEELAANGIGDGVEPCLERKERVTQSSGVARAKDRPDPPDHCKTILCNAPLMAPKKVTLIDDVVTRGSTLVGCAAILQERFPKAEIQGYGHVSVESARDLVKFGEIFEPRIGVVSYNAAQNWLLRDSELA